MSWFNDLAGQAEKLLTKIDQNAAEILQSESDEGLASAMTKGWKDWTEGPKKSRKSRLIGFGLRILTSYQELGFSD